MLWIPFENRERSVAGELERGVGVGCYFLVFSFLKELGRAWMVWPTTLNLDLVLVWRRRGKGGESRPVMVASRPGWLGYHFRARVG